jgi:SAM-dependent methyltransferase
MIRNFFRNPNFSVDSMIEKERYDQRALEDIQKQVTSGKRESGIDGLPLHHHRPFLEFYNLIESNIKESDVVLEIGAGDGRHTFEICKTGAKVYVNDISELQLCLAKERLGERIELIPSDMTN